MRKIKINHFVRGDKTRLLTNQQKHCVYLGNGLNVLFSNINDVYGCLAQVNQFLNLKLFELNEILIEARSLYHRQWFYFNNGLESKERIILNNFSFAEKNMIIMVTRSHFENGNIFVFIGFEKCIESLLEIITILTELQKKRWNYTEAHQLETIIARLQNLRKEIKNFGFDRWDHTPLSEMGLKNWKAEKTALIDAL